METLLIPALKSPYFNSHPIEEEGEIYKYLGVHYFRKLLVISGWEKIRKKETPIRRSLTLLKYYEYRTRASEFGHGIIAIIIVLVTTYVGVAYSFKETIWLIFLNIFFNLYPIMAQRYNRPRVWRVIKKLKLKQSKFTYTNW
ncbi:glycosyl-4,4'-diaponeurosporenoate acyltransferase CrtO family protein [Clostridium sp.]